MQSPCSAIVVRLTGTHPGQNSSHPPPLVVQEATSNDIDVSLVLFIIPRDAALILPRPQHINRVPGLRHVTAAVVVEMQLAAGVQYHSLPIPPLASPSCRPAPPPLLLCATVQALALLQTPHQLGVAAAVGCTDADARDLLLTPIASLLHVCVSAAARSGLLLPVENGWWQPCAVHVEAEGEDEPCASALDAALFLLRAAAAQWPLMKVRCTHAPSPVASYKPRFSCL